MLDAFQHSECFARLNARTYFVARTVLQRVNGIEACRLAVELLDEIFQIDPIHCCVRWVTDAGDSPPENLLERTLRKRLTMALPYASGVGDLAPLCAPSFVYPENIRREGDHG